MDGQTLTGTAVRQTKEHSSSASVPKTDHSEHSKSTPETYGFDVVEYLDSVLSSAVSDITKVPQDPWEFLE